MDGDCRCINTNSSSASVNNEVVVAQQKQRQSPEANKIINQKEKIRYYEKSASFPSLKKGVAYELIYGNFRTDYEISSNFGYMRILRYERDIKGDGVVKKRGAPVYKQITDVSIRKRLRNVSPWRSCGGESRKNRFGIFELSFFEDSAKERIYRVINVTKGDVYFFKRVK